MVEPGNVPQIEERFSVKTAAHDAMTTFKGAVTAMFFPADSVTIPQDGTIDTAGTGIEQELMELIEGNRIPSLASRTSFMDSEFEGQVNPLMALTQP